MARAFPKKNLYPLDAIRAGRFVPFQTVKDRARNLRMYLFRVLNAVSFSIKQELIVLAALCPVILDMVK